MKDISNDKKAAVERRRNEVLKAKSVAKVDPLTALEMKSAARRKAKAKAQALEQKKQQKRTASAPTKPAPVKAPQKPAQRPAQQPAPPKKRHNPAQKKATPAEQLPIVQKPKVDPLTALEEKMAAHQAAKKKAEQENAQKSRIFSLFKAKEAPFVPAPAPKTEATAPTPKVEAPTLVPKVEAPAPAPKAAEPAPAPKAAVPALAPKVEATAPAPKVEAPAPAPKAVAPAPAPKAVAPAPAPKAAAPAPAPKAAAPAPAPKAEVPAPAPKAAAPAPAPKAEALAPAPKAAAPAPAPKAAAPVPAPKAAAPIPASKEKAPQENPPGEARKTPVVVPGVAEVPAKPQKEKNPVKMRRVWISAVAIFCSIMLGTVGFLQLRKWKSANDFEQLAQQIQEADDLETQPTTEPVAPMESLPLDLIPEEMIELMQTEPQPKVLMTKYEDLYLRNPEFFGWLRIDGTRIDYPVMRSTMDNEKYLYANFDGDHSYTGTPFADNECTFESDSIVIYGHNIKDGSMFSGLFNYEDESFWKEHPTIMFSDLYEDYEYEVLAAFYDRVYLKSDTCFKFYQFKNAESQEEFDYAISQFKEKSIYDTGVDAQYGDKLITLVTCAYHVENGRFVVVARRK